MQKQLVDCNRIKSRTDERNNHLKALLDKAVDDVRKARLDTVDREQLDDAMSRAADSKRTLDMLRESLQLREHELQRKNNEYIFLKQNAAKSEKMAKSLSVKLQTAKRGWETKERMMESAHCVEMQKLRNQKDMALSLADNELKAESK